MSEPRYKIGDEVWLRGWVEEAMADGLIEIRFADGDIKDAVSGNDLMPRISAPAEPQPDAPKLSFDAWWNLFKGGYGETGLREEDIARCAWTQAKAVYYRPTGEQRATRAASERFEAFRQRAAAILCETRGHAGRRPCDFCLNVTLFIDVTDKPAAPQPSDKMLAELKRLLSNRELIVKAPSRQWSDEWSAVTDALFDWEPAPQPERLAAPATEAEAFKHFLGDEEWTADEIDFTQQAFAAGALWQRKRALIAEAEKGAGR